MRRQVEERSHSLRHAKQEETATPFALLSKKTKKEKTKKEKTKKEKTKKRRNIEVGLHKDPLATAA